jgi:hypothetical protein
VPPWAHTLCYSPQAKHSLGLGPRSHISRLPCFQATRCFSELVLLGVALCPRNPNLENDLSPRALRTQSGKRLVPPWAHTLCYALQAKHSLGLGLPYESLGPRRHISRLPCFQATRCFSELVLLGVALSPRNPNLEKDLCFPGP